MSRSHTRSHTVFQSRPLRHLFALLAALTLTACNHGAQQQKPAAQQAREQARQQARANAAARTAAREQLEEIPPPAKARYLAIHTLQSWNNPLVIVSTSTVTLRVMNPDSTPSDPATSPLLHPAGARRREIDIHLSRLPEALTSLPEELWPYGRVVAIEEDPAAQRQDRPQVRRNYEATMQMLNDLGVVVNEWQSTGTQ